MSGLLNIGKSGLNSARKSLETVGHNISNVNTEGFSRQRVSQQTSPAIVKDGVLTGRGVFIKSVNRIHDPLVEKHFQRAASEAEYYNSRTRELEKIEDIFTEIDGEGLNYLLNKFYNTFRELANRPDDESMRSILRDTAKLIIKDFRRISSTLNEYVNDINIKLKAEVDQINEAIDVIASLNRKIMQAEASGAMAPDLRDRRDLAVGKLAEVFKIKTYIDNKGNHNVMADNVGSLVVAGTGQPLTASMLSTTLDNDTPGEVRIFFGSNSGRPIDKKFRGGRLSSLLRTRNEDLRQFKENIDNIAYELANTVNAVHSKGFVNRKIRMDDDGMANFSDATGKTTGIHFFKIPKHRMDAAAQIDLSDEVKKDLSNIVTALAPNSPGDNRVALAISKLQHEKVTLGGTATIEEAYYQSVSKIGIEGRKAKVNKEHADGLLNQAKEIRERVSGVSIDEEAANMVRFQHAYDASAKVMQTAKDIFETILSIKE